MRLTFLRLAPLIALTLAAVGPAALGAPANQLTEAEKTAGWRLLFDGQHSTGWRSFKRPSFPTQGWVIEDGCLRCALRGGGGDIITDEEFGDFELAFEWKVAPGANSGVKYFITEQRSSAIGHEYQIIDDVANEDAKAGRLHQTASFYDVLPPLPGTESRPVGEFNQSRILVRGNHVEHWLNGRKVLEYELGSDAVKAAVAKSKFKNVAGFGTKIRGHLLLQEHGGGVWFRNLKLRVPAGQ
jgi:hypothetical protein